MASEIFTREEISLQDGTDIEIRPLVIGELRKFMKTWNDYLKQVTNIIAESKEQEDSSKAAEDAEEKISDIQYDVFIKLCKFGLKELKADKTDKQFGDYLEGSLDEPTIYKILEVTGGLKLGGQNLTQGATAPDGMN